MSLFDFCAVRLCGAVLVGLALAGCPKGSESSGATAGTGGPGGQAGTGMAGGGGAGTGGAGAGAGGEAGFGGQGGVGVAGFGGGAGTGEAGVGGSAPLTNRVEAPQWCTRLAQIQCAAEAHCCPEPAKRFANVAECETAQASVCEEGFMVARIGSDPRVAYDIDAAEQSLQAFEQMTLQCDPEAARFGASPDGLIRMFAGTQGNGGSCKPSSPTDYAAGASCLRGLTCIPTTTFLLNWTCNAPSAAGGPCFSDINCQPGLKCAEPETRSTCEAALDVGASCERATECASLFCESGHCVEPSLTVSYCFRR